MREEHLKPWQWAIVVTALIVMGWICLILAMAL